jgi:glycosyltransferase involved in cell wall biosynthesis
VNHIYIVVDEYSDVLAKRLPWYSIKKLKTDLSNLNYKVIIASSLKDVPECFEGKVIKLFGIKDIFNYKNRAYSLIYLFTSPMITLPKFLTLGIVTIITNWKYLYRIFITSFIPKEVFKITLNRASLVIVVSDNLEDYFHGIVKVYKYIPFISNNWGISNKDGNKRISVDKKLTIGYFGPPYLTRYFDRVIDFFVWIEKANNNYKTKLVTRMDERSLKNIQNKYTKKLCTDNSTVVSGFLSRTQLVKELLEIDFMVLPFRVVMEEMPIVVLESLELGIPVITTKESGVHIITEGQNNVLILDRFCKENYINILTFIDRCSNDNFVKVLDNIKFVNRLALDKICK